MIPSAPTSGSSTEVGRHPVQRRARSSRSAAARRSRRSSSRARGRAMCPTSAAAAAAMRRAFSSPARAGGDVADLAVHDDRAKPSAADRLAAEDHRRAGKLIAREHRGRGGVDVAHEQRRDPSPAGLSPQLRLAVRKPRGKRGRSWNMVREEYCRGRSVASPLAGQSFVRAFYTRAADASRGIRRRG